jgi:tetratricopeptide (TPR) repeat protein
MMHARNHRCVRSKWLPAVSVVAICALAHPARADKAAAKPHVDAGAAAYAAGNYDEASRELERAYALDPDPPLLYARAQALRRGGRCSDAIALYREFIATNPSDQQIQAARTGLETCEQQVVDEKPPEPVLVTEPPPLPPPSPAETAQPPAHETPRWYTDRIGGGLAIGGTVAIGVGIGFLIASSRSRDDARHAEFRADAVDHLDDATFQRRIGIVAIGAGAALLAGGVLRYSSVREPAAPVAITTTGSDVLVFVRF